MQIPVRIDDKKLREQAYGLAEKLLKKLDRLEAQIETFERRDQRQFQDWHELIFRDRRLKLEKVRNDYRDLCRLYNSMIALARMKDISLPEALVLLRDEENLYQSGDLETRRAIDRDRLEREEFIRLESENEARKTQRTEERRRQREEKSEGAEKADRDEELAAIRAMDDDEILQWCKSPEIAGAWLWLSLWAARETGDSDLYFRVWDLTDMKIQKLFARRFENEFDVSLKEIMAKMCHLHTGRDEPPAINDEQEDEAPSATSHTQPSARPKARAMSQAERDEYVKLIYRQLVRKLHPDLQGTERQQSMWQKKIWMRAQSAYRAKDLEDLETLLRLVLLRNGALNDLRLSEIYESRQWLQQELSETEQGIRGLRRSPAWGFSKRKDYGPVLRKIDKQMERERLEAEGELYELQSQMTMLERVGRESARHGQRIRRSRSQHRTRR